MRMLEFLESLDQNKTVAEATKKYKEAVETKKLERDRRRNEILGFLIGSFVLVKDESDLFGDSISYIKVDDASFIGQSTDYEDIFQIEGEVVYLSGNSVYIKDTTYELLSEDFEYISEGFFYDKKKAVRNILSLIEKEI